MLIKKSGTKTCLYAIDSFTLDADGDPQTLDAQVTASLSQGPARRPEAIELVVIDDKPISGPEKRCDHITLVDVGGGYEELLSRCIDRGDVSILGPAIYDNGFYNIATRPTEEDPAVGGEGEFGNPLSFSRQYLKQLLGKNVPDPFQIDECTFEIRFDPVLDLPFYSGGFDEVQCKDGSTTHRPSNNPANARAIKKTRVAVDGAFKVPTVRNAELHGPFFHNGGDAFLEQVVTFYNRGGNFARENKLNLDPDIRPLGLSDQQRCDLVAFMKSLTDDRVRCESEPFDHPELFITHGHPGDEMMVTDDGTGQATDTLVTIPATGSTGRADCPGQAQIAPFLE